MAVAVISPIHNLFFLYLRCCELELINVGGTDADLLSEALLLWMNHFIYEKEHESGFISQIPDVLTDQ